MWASVLRLSTLTLLALCPWAITAATTIANIPGLVTKAASQVEFLSRADGLDGPKISPVNESVFDWWYYDAVSDVDQSSIVVTFFTSTDAAFPFISSSSVVTPVYIWTSSADGEVNSWVLDANSAVVQTSDNGASGSWIGSGVSFAGSADMSTYSITIDASDSGISGTVTFESRAPAHYPCGPAVAGQDMQVAPHIGWANAIPDAHATIDLVVNGEDLTFTGTGYHDKNWSDEPFGDNVSAWLWGHGTLGPYSLIWFDYLDRAGNEYVSAYVARDGQILGQSCSPSSVKVRGTGEGATWPPTESPEGFSVDIDLGGNGVFSVNVSTGLVTGGWEDSPYTRWIGSLSGNVDGSSERLSGVAVFDQILW